MFDCLFEVDFQNAMRYVKDYGSGVECETVDEYAEVFAKMMTFLCSYKVIKGLKVHLNVFIYNNVQHEDREYRFIDGSLIRFLKVVEAPDKYRNYSARTKIRNLALRSLTQYLRHSY